MIYIVVPKIFDNPNAFRRTSHLEKGNKIRYPTLIYFLSIFQIPYFPLFCLISLSFSLPLYRPLRDLRCLPKPLAIVRSLVLSRCRYTCDFDSSCHLTIWIFLVDLNFSSPVGVDLQWCNCKLLLIQRLMRLWKPAATASFYEIREAWEVNWDTSTMKRFSGTLIDSDE